MLVIIMLGMMIVVMDERGVECGKIQPGVAWFTSSGQRIYAGGGGMYVDKSSSKPVYYWVGEGNKLYQDLSATFNLYSSYDLVSWQAHPAAFTNTSILPSEITQVNSNGKDDDEVSTTAFTGPFRMERPKLFLCPSTNRYMLWFHCDAPNFSLRSVGVASSPSLSRAFTMTRPCFRPDNQDSYDMTIYVDGEKGDGRGEGQPYLVRSVMNQYAGVSKLNDDCTDTAGIISKGPRVEGMAVYYDELAASSSARFFLWGSHLTGWSPNPAILSYGTPVTARTLAEVTNWQPVSNSDPNPSHDSTTFNSQSTYILPYVHVEDGHTTFIYMGDRWNQGGPGGLQNATYIWLPINGTGLVWDMPWRAQWDINDF